MENIIFREGDYRDLEKMKTLFYDTITAINAKDYSTEQLDVWRSSIKNNERWLSLVEEQYILIAETDQKLLGFISLKGIDYLDFLYVNKNYQGQKIAQRLYQKIEEKARSIGAIELTSDVSITAKPFFERMGFNTLAKQKQIRKGVELINYKMSKKLS